MKHYELTYIITPDMSDEQAEREAKEIESLVQNKEGVILSSQKPAIQMLSYPIKKKSSGLFFSAIIRTPEEKIKEIKDALEKNKNILRHIILSRKPAKEFKQKRVRRPLFMAEGKSATQPFLAKDSKEKEVDQEKLDKKLEEILSE